MWNGLKQSILSALVAFGVLGSSLSACAQEEDSAVSTVLITGSNRGLGFHFTQQYAQAGWNVIATARRPGKADDLQALAEQYPNVTIEQLDLTDHEGIDALAAQYQERKIDLLLNNAARLGEISRQNFGSVDYELFRDILDVNVLGTLKVTEAFTPHVKQSDQKKIVVMGSMVGTGTFAATTGNFYSYGSSKAALHYLTRHMAFDLKEDGVTVFLMEPGFADSRGVMDMTIEEAPDQETKELVQMVQMTGAQMQAPETSVAGMIEVIDGVMPEQNGSFFAFDGSTIPW